ncbi:ParA family protein [Actinacidiphila yeochonensis]|uniref:ParA family protein n=1 Tax=Actinacidiphila yeochonensis TaxID=89050 RepID=UPI000A40B6F3|nr:ParA family protein [Actinacidiphila yeochonensis]
MAAQVTVVGTLKGGVGKTRLAMMLAFYVASRGKSVRVVDGDTVSQTAYDWQRDAKRAWEKARTEGKAPGPGWPAGLEVVRHPFADVDEYIDGAVEEVDHVLADIGGGNPAVFEAALTRAHRLLVPVGADPSETRKLPATWKSAGNAAAGSTVGGFEAYVVLSRTDHRTSLPKEAREQLGGEYPLCDTELFKRVAYQRAYGQVPTDFLDVPDLAAEVGLIEKAVA